MDRSSRLLLFMDVVDAGSFTAAAERRLVNRSVISKQISALERELEVQLFNRSTRSVALTGIGREIYQSALKLREALDETGDIVKAHQAEPRGTLRISCPVHFGRLHVSRGVRLYLKRYPDMHVELQLDDTPTNLIAGGFDLGIRIEQLEDSSLVARPLARHKRILCASPAFIATYGNPETLNDLIELPAAVYSRNGLELDRLPYLDQNDGLERRIRLHPKIKANDPEVLKQAVLAGIGYSMASLYHVSEELKDGRLVPLLPTLTLCDAPAIQLVYPHRRYLPQKTRRFIECMQEAVGDPPFWEAW